ncbi:MAG: hypothetical protein AB7J30_12805 [Hyphomicrobium sp.]
MDDTEKPPRNPEARCPSCGGQHLYTDYYDKCYACGRHVGEDAPAEAK